MRPSTISIVVLAIAIAPASQTGANSSWDTINPLMMLSTAGIEPIPADVAAVLNDPTKPTELRYWAAMGLAELDATDHIPDLIHALDDPVIIVEQGALLALQQIPSSEAVDPLCSKSRSSGNDSIRSLAINALIAQSGPAATSCIVQGSARLDELYQTRWQALYHLARYRTPDGAYDQLVPVLDDENPNLKALAAVALSRRFENSRPRLHDLRIRQVLAEALLDRRMDMTTYRFAMDRFEYLTGATIMLDPSRDIEYFNFEKKGRAIVDDRIRAWLDAADQ